MTCGAPEAAAPDLGMVVASGVESGGRGEDRVVIERVGTRVLIVVADGAGGTGGGAAAADGVCEAALAMFRTAQAGDWELRLQRIDSVVAKAGHGGQSTGVVVEIAAGEIFGASVGDSGAWLLLEGGVVDLTERQIRKPLLGSGAADPVGFGPVPLHGRLLVATDGLFKYAVRAQLASTALQGAPASAVIALMNAVRMSNGRLQDDVGVVVCDGNG